MAAMQWAGFRRIAERLARPAETVRGWLRRFSGRMEAVRSVFTVWLPALQVDPVIAAPAGVGSLMRWLLSPRSLMWRRAGLGCPRCRWLRWR
jgi:hypothetical protein